MSNFTKPPVGSVVTFTVRHVDYYYKAEQPFIDRTYTARVLEPEKWYRPEEFKVSCDNGRMPFRTINLNNVVEMNIDGVETTENGATKTVQIEGSKGKTYWVSVNNGTPVSCTCPGFSFRRQCRHLHEAVDLSPKKVDNGQCKGGHPTLTKHEMKRGKTTMSNKTLSWNDRFALIDHFKPTDSAICSAFNVTQDELNTARDMRSSGTFIPTPDIDVSAYSKMFESVKTPSGMTSTVRNTDEKPATATKKAKEPKKRGRKGSKISNAFASVPSEPTPVEDFAKEHGVSIAVLRQGKRFDKNPELGLVKVKKDKESKTLMIWRESPEA